MAGALGDGIPSDLGFDTEISEVPSTTNPLGTRVDPRKNSLFGCVVFRAPAIGEEAVVSNAVESVGQDVDQKAAK